MSDDLLKLDKQVCFPLYSATNALVRAYRPLLKPLDLTYPQYLAMMVLWEHDKISVKALGEKLYLDSGTLTPLLKRLESKKLLRREIDLTDERAKVITLTDQGWQLKEQAKHVPTTLVGSVDMTKDELLALKQGCEALLASLNK